MKPSLSILLACTVAILLLTDCAKKKKAEMIQPSPEIPLIGADVDAHGCKATAGYQWSSLQQTCIRSFELPLQLLNADKTFGAGVLFTKDNKQAEVFSPQANLVLTAQSSVLFTGSAGGAEWYLGKKDGKWKFGKKGEATSVYTEQ